MFTRRRYQNGGITREKRKRGRPAVWVLRYRTADGKQPKIVLGTVEELRTKSDAKEAAERYRVNINSRNTGFSPQTFADAVEHYKREELPKKRPFTVKIYGSILDVWIVPRWGGHRLPDFLAPEIEKWLGTLSLAEGSKAKIRNIMSAVFNHTIRHGWLKSFNPITGPSRGAGVRQSAKRERIPDVLTVEEIGKLLSEVQQEPYRTMIFTEASTGVRVSELLGLQWKDIDFESGQINLTRSFVRGNVGELKTAASQKPIPLSEGLAEVLATWRAQAQYRKAEDWLFASPEKHGKQPYWASSVLNKHLRPATVRAGIDKRIGWHTFRHTFGTLLKANGEDIKTVQELLRHANSKITLDVYVQGVTSAKRRAQTQIFKLIRSSVPVCARDKIASV